MPKGTPSAFRRVTQARFTLIFVRFFSQSISQCMNVYTCLVSLNLVGPCGVRAGMSGRLGINHWILRPKVHALQLNNLKTFLHVATCL